MSINAQGRVDLLEGQMDVGARLNLSHGVPRPWGRPLSGKGCGKLHRIYFNLSGSWMIACENIPGQGVPMPSEDQAKGVGRYSKG